MLVSQGLAVGGVKGEVLRRSIKWCAEAEQLAVRTPTRTFLSLFTKIAQVGHGFFAEDPRVFHGVDQGIHQAIEALLCDDREILAELLKGAHTPTQEMAEGQLHSTGVGKTAEELLAILLAAAKGTNEFAHRDLTLGHLGGLHLAGSLGIGLGNVALEHLPVGSTNDLGLLNTREVGLDHKALGTL